MVMHTRPAHAMGAQVRLLAGVRAPATRNDRCATHATDRNTLATPSWQQHDSQTPINQSTIYPRCPRCLSPLPQQPILTRLCSPHPRPCRRTAAIAPATPMLTAVPRPWATARKRSGAHARQGITYEMLRRASAPRDLQFITARTRTKSSLWSDTYLMHLRCRRLTT